MGSSSVSGKRSVLCYVNWLISITDAFDLNRWKECSGVFTRDGRTADRCSRGKAHKTDTLNLISSDVFGLCSHSYKCIHVNEFDTTFQTKWHMQTNVWSFVISIFLAKLERTSNQTKRQADFLVDVWSVLLSCLIKVVHHINDDHIPPKFENHKQYL